MENLVTPIKQSLEKVDTHVRELEKARQHAYGSLTEQVKSLISTQEKLQSETGTWSRRSGRQRCEVTGEKFS